MRRIALLGFMLLHEGGIGEGGGERIGGRGRKRGLGGHDAEEEEKEEE